VAIRFSDKEKRENTTEIIYICGLQEGLPCLQSPKAVAWQLLRRGLQEV